MGRQFEIRIDATGACRFEILDEEGNDARHEVMGRGDSVAWISRTGDLLIDFASGRHPFDQNPPFAANKGYPTIRVTVGRNASSGSYYYYATVNPQGCTARLEIVVP